MDTRRLITAVLVTLVIVLGYQLAFRWLYDRMGWVQPGQSPPAATQPATQPADGTAPSTAPGLATSPSAQATTQPSAPVVQSGVRVAPATQPGPTVVLGSSERNDPTYRLALSLSATGAAVERVVLNEFTREVKSKDPYVFQQPPTDKPATRALATRALVVDGTRVDLDGAAWSLESSSDTKATYALAIDGDAGPLLRLRKTYEIFDRSAEGAGYEVDVRHSIENLAARPLEVKVLFNGTLTPPREVDRGPDRYMVAGYAHAKGVSIVHHAIEEFSNETRSIDLSKQPESSFNWAGALSVYFVAIARPADAAAAGNIAKAEAVAFNPEAPPHERDAGVVFETAAMQVPAGQSTTLPLRVFFGPRQRGLLQDTYFSKFGYHEILVLTGGPCAYCTFQWLINLLVLLLRAFHFVTRDWGLAIVGLVVLVRLLLHPVTKKSQVSMMKMGKFGPELQRLREKHGDNKDELNKAMMGFYKEQGFSPVLGCLPMFLQMPIWIALWSALNSTFELRHAAFLYGYTWIDDLAKPDHLIEFSSAFDLWFLHIDGLNLLPILMGLVFYIQMKFQPKPVAPTKEQEQQQKIMMWMMPILFPIMLYSGPSGLNLYILTSTLIGIWESKRIRDHIKQQDEAEAQQRVIIDAKPTRGSKKAHKPEPPNEPKRGIAGWLANLQEKADQVRRDTERRGKDKA